MEQGREIVVEGLVQALLENGKVRVKLADGSCIQAEIPAKIKVRFIGVEPGDLVRCEVSPIDPARARVVEKL